MAVLRIHDPQDVFERFSGHHGMSRVLHAVLSRSATMGSGSTKYILQNPQVEAFFSHSKENSLAGSACKPSSLTNPEITQTVFPLTITRYEYFDYELDILLLFSKDTHGIIYLFILTTLSSLGYHLTNYF